MVKRSCALLLPAVLLAAVVPLASASSSSHTLKLTLHSFTVSTTSKSDAPGTRQTGVGIVTGKPFGQAVSTLNDKVTSASRSDIEFAGKITIYSVRGSMTGTVRISVKPGSSGATGSGSGRLTGGTGTFRGAHGSFHFTGSQSGNAPDFTAHITGTVSF